MPRKYEPVKLKGNYQCEGCKTPFALKFIGKWRVLAKGMYEEQEYDYNSCEECESDIRQKTYHKAYRALKEKHS